MVNIASLTPGQIGPVQEVARGIYTSEACSPLGDRFYLGMEELDIHLTRDTWKSYVTAIKALIGRAPGGMLYAISLSLENPEDVEELKENRGHSCFGKLEDKEFNDILNKLLAREIYPNGKRFEALEGINGGITGFEQITPTYVAYASTVPITGRVKFWESPDDVPFSYKAIADVVSPMIMTVGVKLVEGKPFFQNRGIFRNPLRVIEGGYTNISTQLHAFTGKVMQDCVNPELKGNTKEYMAVAALPKMASILTKKMTESGKNCFTKSEIPEDLYYFGGKGAKDVRMVIPVEDLASLHG